MKPDLSDSVDIALFNTFNVFSIVVILESFEIVPLIRFLVARNQIPISTGKQSSKVLCGGCRGEISL